MYLFTNVLWGYFIPRVILAQDWTFIKIGRFLNTLPPSPFKLSVSPASQALLVDSLDLVLTPIVFSLTSMSAAHSVSLSILLSLRIGPQHILYMYLSLEI